MRTSTLSAALVTIALGTLGALAAPAAEPAQRQLVDRVYDIRDALVVVPDLTDAPALGIHDPPAANAPPAGPKGKTQAELTAEVIDLVRSLAPPRELAGGRIADTGQGQLIVRATPAGQAAIAATIEQLRQRHMPQTIVEAQVIRPDAKAMEKLAADAPALARKLKLASFDGGLRAGTPLTAAEVEALRAAEGFACPRITLFSGQRGYVLTATQRAFVAAITPDLKPQVKTIESGVVLDARATPTPDGRFVALAGQVRHCVLHAMADAPAPNAPPNRKDLVIQVPDYETQTVRANAVLPDGGWVLFGATESIRPNAPDAKAGAVIEPRPTYAVLRATVIRNKAAAPEVN
jgi:hypothetical protein